MSFNDSGNEEKLGGHIFRRKSPCFSAKRYTVIYNSQIARLSKFKTQIKGKLYARQI
jgi:hypothetical protein